MKALFTSNHALGRAENITAVYNSYEGAKDFVQVNPYKPTFLTRSRRYGVRVTDEFPNASPGKCIYIGHGISGGKLVGLDQPYPYYRRESAELITYTLATSEDMIDIVAKQFGVPRERVLPLGMPRTDALIGKRKGDGGTALAGKRAYLYCPTYRTREEMPYPVLDWDAIDAGLSDDEVLAVKPHMVTKHILEKEYKHIVELSSEDPTGSYLIDCDVLITDYSSILMDAHLLRKPVVLFSKEDSYLTKRGMYLPYPSGYASRHVNNEADLVDCIRSAEGQGKEDLECMRVTAGACDGHSTERVINLINRLVRD